MKKFIYSMIAMLMMAFTMSSMSSCSVVDANEIGIEFHKWSSDNDQYGGVVGTCTGWVFYNPITTSVFTYPGEVQRKNYEPFTVNAKDASTFTMDPQIAYHINPAKAAEIFRKYRKPIEELEAGYIRTCIYEAYLTCANAYTSDSLMSNRANAKISASITPTLVQKMWVEKWDGDMPTTVTGSNTSMMIRAGK